MLLAIDSLQASLIIPSADAFSLSGHFRWVESDEQQGSWSEKTMKNLLYDASQLLMLIAWMLKMLLQM